MRLILCMLPRLWPLAEPILAIEINIKTLLTICFQIFIHELAIQKLLMDKEGLDEHNVLLSTLSVNGACLNIEVTTLREIYTCILKGT